MGRGVRAIQVACALVALLACGEVPETRTIRYGLVPTPDVAPTQTRAAELAQIATLTAPPATPTVTPIPPSPTATATATPIPATPTPSQAFIAGHRQWFATKRRTILGSGAEDVTGDGRPDYLYRSSGEGCGSCRGTRVTVFAGDQLLFDQGAFNDGTVAVAPDHLGFVVTESVVNPGESFANASGRITYAYRFAGGTFALVDKQASGIVARSPTATASAAQMRANLLREIDLYDREAHSLYAPAQGGGIGGHTT